jgi:GDP-mannose 6-dehydrogenase
MKVVPQRISIFGLGYVGSVMAACLAHQGHSVTGVDVNPTKVEMLASGRSPIVETQMEELLIKAHEACRIQATCDVTRAIRETQISFVCVGTPSRPNGGLDLTHLDRVCREIGEALTRKTSWHLVALRSTVLPGTTKSMVIPLLEAASAKQAGVDFAVCYNPEFMREGTGVADFLQPPYTVLGAENPEDLASLRQVYGGIGGRVFETSLAVAEMVKYVSNAFHAVKVSFANEVGTLCKKFEVDTQAVTEIFTSDTKLNISPAYLKPGFAFGGSCLPKDLRALTYRAKELDLQLPLLQAVIPSNVKHIERTLESILRAGKKKVAMLGLSFKPGTDDLRESPQVSLIKHLLGEGCEVRIWDQHVSMGRVLGSNRRYIEEVIPHIGSLLQPSLELVVMMSEIIVIATAGVDLKTLATLLRPDQVVIDLVNLEKSQRIVGGAPYEGICW